MADTIDEVTKKLERLNKALDSTSKKMETFGDGLDTKTLHKFFESAQKALKGTNEYGKKIAESAKNFRQLTDAVKDVEEQLDKLQDVEKDHVKQVEKLNAKYEKFDERRTRELKLLEAALLARQEERKHLKEIVDGMKEFGDGLVGANKNLLKFQSLLSEVGTDVKKNLSFGALGDTIKEKMGSAAKSTFTWSNAMGAATEALKLAYKDLFKIADLGLGAQFARMRIDAFKFNMSLEEYTAVVQKNRQTINLLGGGAEGMAKFTQVINQSLINNQGLVKRLGTREASKAIGDFTSALAAGGATAGSGSFMGAMQATSDTFLLVNQLYGMSAEEVAKHTKAMVADESVQRRLIAMNKEEQGLEQKRLQLMTQELVKRGLTLEQIEKFNTQLENIYDPTKSRASQRVKQAAGFELMVAQMAAMGEDVDLAGAQKHTQLVMAGRTREAAELNKQMAPGIASAKARLSARAGEGAFGGLQTEGVNIAEEMGGAYTKFATELGQQLEVAKMQGRALSEAQVAATAAAANLSEPLIKLRDTVQMLEAALNPAITKAVEALIVFTTALLAGAGAGALGGAGKLLKGGAGLAAKGIGGLAALGGGGAAGLAVAGAGVAGAGLAGYGLGTAAYRSNFLGIQSGARSLTEKMFGSTDVDINKQPTAEELQAARQRRLEREAAAGKLPTAPAATMTNVGGGDKQVVGVVDSGPGFTTVKYADGSVEKRSGTAATRNNNPGNIRPGNFATQAGAVGVSNTGVNGQFAVFPTVQAGLEAQKKLLTSDAYSGLTVSQAIAKYAPPKENNTAAYQKAVLGVLGSDKRMADLSPQELNTMMAKMHEVEGYKGAATGAPIPPTSVATSTPAAATNPSAANPQLAELQRHTTLLAQIAGKMGGAPAYAQSRRQAAEQT